MTAMFWSWHESALYFPNRANDISHIVFIDCTRNMTYSACDLTSLSCRHILFVFYRNLSR